MRNSLVLLAALVLTVVLPDSARSQTIGLEPNRTIVDFGLVTDSASPRTMQVEIRSITGDEFQGCERFRFTVQRATKPKPPFSSVPLVPPPVVVCGAGESERVLRLDITFDPKDIRVYSDEIILEYENTGDGTPDFPRGRKREIRIALVGQRACTDANSKCSPAGPACIVDQNVEPHYHLTVPTYTKSVPQLIKTHNMIHNEAFLSYALPITFLWNIFGMDQIVEPPQGCCLNCSSDCPNNICNAGCPSDVKFRRPQAKSRLASFDHQVDGPRFYGSKHGLPFSIEIHLPGVLKGSTNVGPTYSEFHFSDSSQSPMIKVTDTVTGEVIFNGSIACVGSTLDYATIKLFNATGQPSSAHGRIDEK